MGVLVRGSMMGRALLCGERGNPVGAGWLWPGVAWGVRKGVEVLEWGSCGEDIVGFCVVESGKTDGKRGCWLLGG